EQRVVDTVWVSDGAWAAYDDTIFGGRGQVELFELPACRERTLGDGLDLSGCAEIRGRASEFMGIARHLGQAVAPLDLSGFDGMRFWMRSSTPLTVCVDEGFGAERRCAEVAATTGTTVELPWSAFHAVGSACDPSQTAVPERASLFTFTHQGAGQADLAVHGLALVAGELDNDALEPAECDTGRSGCTQTSAPAWLALLALLTLARRLKPRT
ncbi:MAG: hypothetical protein AAFQ82_13885, partial [Myxococcota bacterium]